jgi:hypothetical protein
MILKLMTIKRVANNNPSTLMQGNAVIKNFLRRSLCYAEIFYMYEVGLDSITNGRS